MGCEKAKGGFVSSIRSSMERRRVSNAKVTSLRQRKYQELTMQREQEKLQRAKEILERRKSERDRLNEYMHSFGNPYAKHPDHLRGMRRPNTDGMFGRPQWTASLRSDYETLIKLREKEIAVATLRIENHKQLPYKSMQSEEDTNHSNGSDEPYLLNEEFEFHQDTLEQEFDDNRFDTNHKSNDSYSRNDMEDLEELEHGLFAFANETEKYHTDIGRDLLLIEPTVFREHSFNGQRTGAGSLPPRPPSISKVVTPPLKSCLKSNKDNQKSISPLSETPENFSQASSDRVSSGTSQTTVVANLDMETAIVPVSNAPQRTLLTMTNSAFKTMTNRFLNPWDDHQEMDYADDSFEVPFDLHCKEYPYPQPADDLGIPGQTFSMSTVSNVEALEKQASATDPSDNAFSEYEILRPKLSRQMESESADVLSWSGKDTQFQETQRGDLNSPNASFTSDSVQLGTPICSALPPRYTSTSEFWQEEKAFESSIPDVCHTPPLLTSPERYEDKNWESFITSLDSEAATTRLLAEVVAIQSRLEDCKLKPLDFKDIFEEPYYPGRDHRRLEQQWKNEMTPTEDLSSMRFPLNDDHELVNTQNEQGVIDMNMRNHEIMPIDTDEIGEFILDTEFRIEEKIAENASNADVASSVDDHEKDALTTAPCSSDRIDNFTEMPNFEEIESRKKLHAAAWEIPWKSGGQRSRQEEPSADQGCSAAKNELPANSTVVSSPFPCTITTPSKPEGSTTPVDFHSEKINQSRVLNNEQPRVRHVTVQTENGLEKSGETPHCHLRSPGISTNSGVPHCDRAENKANLSDRSLLSTERTSRYLNNGYRDLSEAPRTSHPKHCFYSSQGLLQVGYSQPRQSPQPVKQNVPQNNRQAQACRFHDSLGDKENCGMSGPDDQELSILASLERLDWKLAAISARAMNRTNTTPSLVSQDQLSIQSAPAATGVKGLFPDITPGKFPANQLRPSSVSTQKPPTRNFRQRRIVGVTNKFHQDIYN